MIHGERMGQAKDKMSRLERIRQHQPFCVYCGGTTPIETIEHIPPISMFDLRRRPKGLEFGACYACNHGSRHDDIALAVVSRSFPDPVGNALISQRRPGPLVDGGQGSEFTLAVDLSCTTPVYSMIQVAAGG